MCIHLISRMRVVTLRYAHGIFYRCSDDKGGLNPETAAVMCSNGELTQEVGSTGQTMMLRNAWDASAVKIPLAHLSVGKHSDAGRYAIYWEHGCAISASSAHLESPVEM